MKVRSLKKGETVADRVIVSATNASAPTPDPTGRDGWGLNGADYLHVYTTIDAAGPTAATVTPWFYSSIAGKWFEGDPLNFTLTDRFALVEIRGEEKVHLVIDSVTGANDLDVWGGYSFEGRDP